LLLFLGLLPVLLLLLLLVLLLVLPLYLEANIYHEELEHHLHICQSQD